MTTYMTHFGCAAGVRMITLLLFTAAQPNITWQGEPRMFGSLSKDDGPGTETTILRRE